MKRILILLGLILLQTNLLQAQKDATEKRNTITFQPLQLFHYGGLRFDFEQRLGKNPTWLQLSLTGYPMLSKKDKDKNSLFYDDTEYWNPFGDDFSSMWGAAADLNCKYFFNQKQSLYFGAGLSYGYFNVKYEGSSWVNYEEDQLEYYEYYSGEQEQIIKRLGVNMLFGIQIPTQSAFIFDVYTGLSYRHGIYDKYKRAYDEGFFSPGRRGTVFLLGMRIGLGW